VSAAEEEEKLAPSIDGPSAGCGGAKRGREEQKRKKNSLYTRPSASNSLSRGTLTTGMVVGRCQESSGGPCRALAAALREQSHALSLLFLHYLRVHSVVFFF